MNDWLISEALISVRRLEGVAHRLTLEEIEQAIALEEAAGRRKSLLTRLRRLARTRAADESNKRIKDNTLL